jgi:internalin A
MSTDLDILKQLEQTIGRKLEKLDRIKWNSVGYVQNEHNKITGLDLYDCGLKELPSEIGKLQNLTKLNLWGNQLSDLPPEIVKLQNLTYLLLGNNQLSDLPPEIVKLQNLNLLDLGGNQFSNLPPVIGELQKLTELNLEANQLSNLPPEIGKLQTLKTLLLQNNNLTELASEICKLPNLVSLGLNNNQLNKFPKALLDLNLDIKWDSYIWGNGIHVEGNPFEIPPVEIVKQGRQAIIDYYTALDKEPDRLLNESKLILIGDGGVGKTSLMKRLLGQEFNQQESQTHGININTFSLKHNDNDIKLHCWDFGGQQIMHATHQFFLSKRCLYLLVLDSRRETQVDYWLKHIQSFGKNAPVIIVINKIDENPYFDLPQKRQLKKDYSNLKHICRISCATQAGISELNNAIQNTLPDIELLNTLFPAKWFKVKTAITKQTKETNFTSYEHYVDICQIHGITKESEQNTLIHFLHDLGLVNHFQDRWLRETNVINPQWITEAVYTIINAPQLAGNGKLHRNDLKSLLDNDIYPVRKHDYIIELMKKFELCYPLNDDEYLLPDLFPIEEPEFEFDDEHALHFILEYDFLPKSIFTRFIVRMHSRILNNNYWRSGVILYDCTTGTTALVETVSNRLELKLTGPQKREDLLILRFVLTDIHRSFSHLSVTEKIGLPDNKPRLSVNYDYLAKLAEKGQSEYLPPENPEKSYEIKELLGKVTTETPDTDAMLQKIINILETQGIQKEKDLLDRLDEVVKIKPGLFGISINVNALLKKWKKKRSKA